MADRSFGNVPVTSYPYQNFASLMPAFATGMQSGQQAKEQERIKMMAATMPAMIAAQRIGPTMGGGKPDITAGGMPFTFQEAPPDYSGMKNYADAMKTQQEMGYMPRLNAVKAYANIFDPEAANKGAQSMFPDVFNQVNPAAAFASAGQLPPQAKEHYVLLKKRIPKEQQKDITEMEKQYGEAKVYQLLAQAAQNGEI
jgi:hypothetical protein